MAEVRKLAFIWDMDGTLVDSYPAIVPGVRTVCEEYGLRYSEEYIREYVLRSSVGTLLEEISREYGLDLKELKSRFNTVNDANVAAIRPIPHVKEVLQALSDAGHLSFIYTHRGASCHTILEQTGLRPFFTEVLTALDGFPRKPEPDAILHLVEKYALLADHCFYVGDRSLDIEAACNAGIRSILYLDPASPLKPTGLETHVVHDLREIPEIVRQITV